MKKIISGVVIVVVIIAAVFLLLKTSSSKNPAASSTSTNQQALASSTDQAAQAQMLIEKLSKIMLLPQGEQPIIATINDAAALVKEQAFYTGAINGDVVFIFQNAAKAIVYSPSRNIIVNVGPILPQPTASTTATTTKKK